MAVTKKRANKKSSQKSATSKGSAGRKGSSGKNGDPDRCDWVGNQSLIESKYYEHLEKLSKIPTTTWLARETGLDRKTISKHLKTFDFARVRRRMGLLLKLTLDKFASATVKEKKPFFKDVELLFKIANQLTEKVEVTGRIDFRSYKDKLNNANDDFERAKRLSEILVSQNLI